MPAYKSDNKDKALVLTAGWQNISDEHKSRRKI